MFNDSKTQKDLKDQLLSRWDKAINAYSDINDEQTAIATAITMENYLSEINTKPQLIAEDRVTSNAWTGINLALLGLIRRVIPNIVGAELVGMQAMPTPRSPIFTWLIQADTQKGTTRKGDELWASPRSNTNNPLFTDPYWTSQQIKEEDYPLTTSWDSGASDVAITGVDEALNWANIDQAGRGRPNLIKGSLYAQILDPFDNSVIADFRFVNDRLNDQTAIDPNTAGGQALYSSATPGENTGFANTMDDLISYSIDGSGVRSINVSPSSIDGDDIYITNPNTKQEQLLSDYLQALGSGNNYDLTLRLQYEYSQEYEANMPELTFSMNETYVDLIRRTIRGKYTMDSAYDLKVLHGINLENEITTQMKTEILYEINKEIVNDLRSMAFLYKELDFNDYGTYDKSGNPISGVTIAGNYQDSHKLVLDAIGQVSAEIANVGRLGEATWMLANPTTLAFLRRVPGFVDSGVKFSGKSVSWYGDLGTLKIYSDPTYPKDEFLFGYKGSGATQAGYIYAPYLPITPAPTLYDPQTGDPSKIFYTRYGKTYQQRGGGTDGSLPVDHIIWGKYQYARLVLKNKPNIML